jgi:hypothetical protein
MARRTRRELVNQEIGRIQEELSQLSIRLGSLQDLDEPTTQREFRVGDQVRFYLNGEGYVEGVFAGRTAQRVRIRYNGNIYIRAPHNVTLVR